MPKHPSIERLEEWVAGRVPAPYSRSEIHQNDVRYLLLEFELMSRAYTIVLDIIRNCDDDALTAAMELRETANPPSSVH